MRIFSQGASLVRNEQTSRETLRVEHPYTADECPVVEVRAGKGGVRLWSSKGSEAALSFSRGKRFSSSLAPWAAVSR